MLTGLCDSGKTVFFGQILKAGVKETFSSISVNVGLFNADKGYVRVVDIPGQERLRLQIYDKYKEICKAVIFIIDSVTVQKDIRDVAE